MTARIKFLLAIDADLRTELVGHAKQAGRSINSEITRRLVFSLDQEKKGFPVGWQPLQSAPQQRQEASPNAKGKALGKNEAALLRAFNLLSPAKQLALLSLFTPE